jgi:ABC-type molybdate transport system substrate-binding protein
MPASDAARAAALMAAAIALGAPAAAQTAAPGPVATELVVYAAGSLRRALTTVAADFERAAP